MTIASTEPTGAPTPHIAKLFELADDLLAVTTADLRLTLVSPSWTRLLGWTEAELLGRPVPDLLHPDDRETAARALQQPGSGPVTRDLLVRCATADGGWRRLAWRGRWTGDGWYTAARDVTETQVLAHRALHDPLTGLPNRLALGDRLSVALARQARFGTLLAILFIDLDHFKLINDVHGHAMGDQVLRAAADRITDAVRGADTVARFGGDEFVVLAEGLTSEQEALSLALRVIEGFQAPLDVAGEQLQMTPSVGVAVARTGAGRGPEELLREADIAMYRAKGAGRGRAELFDAQMSAAVSEQRLIAGELRHAVERGELWVAYQPIVALRDGTVTGVEALLRWDHPTRGPIAPARFVALAEENGLIVEIGTWVLEQAVTQAARWRASGRNLSVAVNVSTLQLLEGTFPDRVADALQAAGLPAAALVLELVEERLARSPDRLRPPTQALAALGVRIALDDFGEGATSLSQFGRLPLHQVKLARSLAHDVGHDAERRAVMAAVISLADEMELEVVVEGVESEAQVAKLRGLGCELAQGFWFSPPRRAGELALDGYSPRALPGLGDPSMVREFMRQIGLPARIS